MTLLVALLLASDGGTATQRFEKWSDAHRLACDDAGVCDVVCVNGRKPRFVVKAGELAVTCEAPKPR